MMRVKATREGLVGQKTACGWIIDRERAFCALPSTKALHKRVTITNPANGRSIDADVLDVGPWNEHDDAYVFGGARPAAETGLSVSGHGANGAGIDLGEAVWNALQMTDNAPVEWAFLDSQV